MEVKWVSLVYLAIFLIIITGLGVGLSKLPKPESGSDLKWYIFAYMFLVFIGIVGIAYTFM